MRPDTNKTLQEIEGKPLEKPNFGSSLSNAIHELYKNKPIGQFDAGDLRIFIGQKFYLNYLTPLAIDLLENKPWVDGTYFEGDLLESVIKVPSEFWDKNAYLKPKLDSIIKKALANIPPLADKHIIKKLNELKIS